MTFLQQTYHAPILHLLPNIFIIISSPLPYGRDFFFQHTYPPPPPSILIHTIHPLYYFPLFPYTLFIIISSPVRDAYLITATSRSGRFVDQGGKGSIVQAWLCRCPADVAPRGRETLRPRKYLGICGSFDYLCLFIC